MEETAVRSVSKARIAVSGFLAAGVGALTTLYGAYLADHTGESLEMKLLGGWLLSAAGIAIVLLAQVAVPDEEPHDWRTQLLRPALGLLSGGAALVHFAAIGEHFTEYWLFGLFFLALSLFQMGWAIAVMVRPGRHLLWMGVVANAFVVGVWTLSRIRGLPFGPESGEPMGAGFGDGVVTAFEVFIVGGSMFLLIATTGRGSLRPVTVTAVTFLLGLIVLAVTALALISVGGGSVLIPPAG
jgi:hypothetical protein